MNKPKMTMKQNLITGEWLCRVEGVCDQVYYAHSRVNAVKFCATVNDELDRGLVLVRNGRLVAKRYLVTEDGDGGWTIAPDVRYRKKARIICVCQSLEEAKDYLRWLNTNPSDGPF